MELEELKAKLAEYKSLTDPTELLMYPPPPKVAIRCKECGKIYDYFQPTWDDVDFGLKKGRDPLREISGLCPKCAGPEEEEESSNPTAKERAIQLMTRLGCTWEVRRADYPRRGPEIEVFPPEGYTFNGELTSLIGKADRR